jgi:hypothetical protein
MNYVTSTLTDSRFYVEVDWICKNWPPLPGLIPPSKPDSFRLATMRPQHPKQHIQRQAKVLLLPHEGWYQDAEHTFRLVEGP